MSDDDKLRRAAELFRAEMRDPDHPVFGVENMRRWKWAEARLSLKACPHCGGDLDKVPEP